MAKYTIELGTLLENGFQLDLNSYPIYDEKIRDTLNQLIIDHFYFREIGYETPQLFNFALSRKMREIMPYYNQLYKSESVEFNPLYNIDITETFEQNSANSGNTNLKTDKTSSGENENISVGSDTPQSRITEEEIRNNAYASQVQHDQVMSTDKENENSIRVSEENGNTTYTKKTEGSSAGLPFSKAIKQWRDIMLNINMEIINELEPLFIQLW